MNLLFWGDFVDFALIIAIAIAVLSLTGLTILLKRNAHLGLQMTPATEALSSSIAVVIPAYNEAGNVRECLLSVLNSTSSPGLEVWLIDDQSTDETLAIAQTLHQELSDPRLHVLAGAPRPADEIWVGKNWACVQGAEQAKGEFLLFLDADTRLLPGAIEAAVQQAQKDKVDLLSCGPAIECGCLAEWLVQPLMFCIINVGFDFDAVNDPQSDKAFAAGPFMLFRRSAYHQIGGHRAVAHQVVEDVELSRLIKYRGLRLQFLDGSDFVTVRMYQTTRALWEGWTKNFYMGSQRHLSGTLGLVGMMLWLCTLPWVALGLALVLILTHGVTLFSSSLLLLSLLAVAQHYNLRRIAMKTAHIPPNYWWLTGLGGLMVAAIAIASIIKTETGWGWTWRGRSLKLPAG
jgi:cellulose synthase/poly-beta-1,6-N-acetylglucosamine synthase-like glycosyltransferase